MDGRRVISPSSAIVATGCAAAPGRICCCPQAAVRSGNSARRAGQVCRHPTPTALTGALRREARAPRAVLVTKANTRATVHRGSYLDYVGVRTFDARGRVTGEHRFLGLWTSSAYESSPRTIPLLKDKINAVIECASLRRPAATMPRRWLQVLETYPRDELFQASVAELVRNVRGIVNLYERSQVRLFARRDPFGRFYSCLVYVPRDRYDARVRARIETVLRADLGGQTVETPGRDFGLDSGATVCRGALGSAAACARGSGEDRARAGARGLDLAGRPARCPDRRHG